MDREDLLNVMGADRVLDDTETLERYSRDHSFAPPRKPSFVVKPKTAAEVHDLVRVATRTRTPLIPVSSGEPRFRGDTVPALGGVVLDLSGMNRIRWIDRKDRVAMIEPGVRFGPLQAELARKGLRLPMPLCPRQTKSVVASCLEREPHVLPRYHLDHSDPLLCNEVIFGTGDVFRTGEAGGPGTIEEQHQAGRRQKIPMGIQMNISKILQGSQGTLGVVTWSTVKCELLPQIQRPLLAASESLEQILEFAHRLVRLRLGDETFILNASDFSLLMGDREAAGEGLKESLPAWILFVCFSGNEFLPEERVSYQQQDASEIAKDLGIPLHEALGHVSAKEVLKRVSKPSPDPYWKLRWGGGCQDIVFISSFAKVPGFVKVIMDQAAQRGFPTPRVGVHIQPVCQGHGHHCEFSLFYDASDARERDGVRELYLSAAGALMNRGAFFSRPYDLLAETVCSRDAPTRDALRKLKGIFDPAHILNPGKLCF